MAAPYRAPLEGHPLDFSDGTYRKDRKDYWLAHQRPAPPTSFARLFNWTEPDHARPGQSRPLGQFLRQMYYSRMYVPHDADWVGERPLGAGTFGTVALFRKENNTGDVIDRMVVKTAEMRDWQGLPDQRDVPTEAEVMRQLNSDPQKESILMLRGFKSFSHEREWRFYLEHCPYGDLERLRKRYKAWGHYLPELFLWHVFLWLVNAANGMEKGPFTMYRGHRKGQQFDEAYVLHSDIKEANVFLGHEPYQDNDKIEDYPMPKMADFGLASVVHPVDITSRWENQLNGTPMWQVPEVRRNHFPRANTHQWYPYVARVPADSIQRFPSGRVHAPIAHHIGPEANIFPIGMIMLCLMTLDEPGDLDARIENILGHQNPLPGHHIFPAIVTRQDAEHEYSPDLRRLVRACLVLVPLARVPVTTLLPMIQINIASLQNKLIQEHGEEGMRRHTKVYFRDNEINDLEPGPYVQPLPDYWWYEFAREEMFEDPSWGRLFPPGHPTRVRTDRFLEPRWGASVDAFRNMPLRPPFPRNGTQSARPPTPEPVEEDDDNMM